MGIDFTSIDKAYEKKINIDKKDTFVKLREEKESDKIDIVSTWSEVQREYLKTKYVNIHKEQYDFVDGKNFIDQLDPDPQLMNIDKEVDQTLSDFE